MNTTSTLLAHPMFAEGSRNVLVGASAVKLRKEMKRGSTAAVGAVRTMARPVNDQIDTAHIATVSAHGDATIGSLVAEAVAKVGSEGVVGVKEARGTQTTLEGFEGMQFDKGFLSSHFVTDGQTMEAVLDRPLILFIDRKISTMTDLLFLLEEVLKAGRSRLIGAENAEMPLAP